MNTKKKSIAGILSKFKNLRETATGWQASCPAHNDNNPSLSISVRGEKVLLHCFADCETQDILVAIGLTWADLNLDDERPKVVAKYNYHDESGKLLYQVQRYEPKDFSVRRPDGAGDWINDIKDTRRVPYCLDELQQADRVLVVEGEKDAGTARDMGFDATTNLFGAGKWRAEYNEHFRGKKIRIIGDDDEPGWKHARSVACQLFGVANYVKIVRLPDAMDLTDWVNAGGTQEQLVQIMKATPRLTADMVEEWRASNSKKDGFHLTKLGELLDEPEEKISWTVEGILPTRGISLLVAKPKTGKSTLARQLAVRVARGKKFLGRKTNQGRVLYLALEEKRDEVRKHFADLGVEGNEEIYVHCSAAPQDAMTALFQLVQDKKPSLVIIDPILRLIRLADANDYAQVNLALEPLLSLAREHTHILLVHHLRKGESSDAADAILGSTAFFGAVDTALLMQRTEHFRTIQTRQRYGKDLSECVLDFNEERRSMSLGAPREEADAERVASQILTYLQHSKRGKTREEIEAEVKGRTSLKRVALRSLVNGQKVLRTGSGAKGDPYLHMCGAEEQQSKVESSE